jgi:tRNA pseudouridine13 synthase
MMYVHAYQSYLWNELVSERWENGGGSVVVGDFIRDERTHDIVVVDDDNVGMYSIFEVVLRLPSDDAGPQTVALMARDGITPNMFRRIAGEYGVSGDWRNMMAIAKDLECGFIRHNGMDDPLIDSDLDRLEGTTNTGNHVSDGSILSLYVSFSLGSGQYATMCLREILKRSTEATTDSAMSQQAKRPPKPWWQICSVA